MDVDAATTVVPARQRETAKLRPGLVLSVLLPAVAAYAAIFAFALQHTTYDFWGALIWAPVLVAISVPILLRYASGDPNPRIGPLLVVALILKLAAALPRWAMIVYLYERGDAQRYAETATTLRENFLDFDFSLTPLASQSRTGTQFVEIVTGIVYTLIGPTFIGGFLFFSWLSFWGLFFFYRAFRVAIPDGDTTRYALLLFFLPSMLFWPSSIGKEAWMTFVLGLTVYGCALLLSRRRGAFLFLVLGLAGILSVRPHMALPVIAGLGLAYLLRGRSARRVVALGKTRTLIGLAVIGIGTLFVIRQVATFFGIDEFNLDTATETLEEVERRSGQGGSEFVGTGPSLRNLPLNVVTVLFRPFPFEVHNVQALLAAFEGVVLLVLFVLSWPRLKTVPKRLFKQPYVTFCVTYAILYCFMFSAVQNFGILARQRVLVFPFVLVLLALPLASSWSRGWRNTGGGGTGRELPGHSGVEPGHPAGTHPDREAGLKTPSSGTNSLVGPTTLHEGRQDSAGQRRGISGGH
jgi:hypothetical protein